MLKPGKLPPEVLKRLLAYKGAKDPSVKVGPSIGEDAAVIDFGQRYLVLKTDPITFATDLIGWYAVHVNANDIATRGARPRWFQPAILLPEGTKEPAVREIFRQIHGACRYLGVAVTGGHTEVTLGIERPIVVGDMQGVVEKGRLVTTSGAKAGDHLVLTKAAGIEGTSIMAREKESKVRKRFGKGFLRRAKGYIFSPGISVVREALLIRRFSTSMHDPTEGGVATAVHEMCSASGTGALIERERIPIGEETRALCRFFNIDPLGLLGSGALLIATRFPEKVVGILGKEGMNAAVIGRLTPRREGVMIKERDKKRRLKMFIADEITKVL